MRSSRLAVGLGGLVILTCFTGAAWGFVHSSGTGLSLVALAVAISGYVAVGFLIAFQVPRNPVGWLLLAGALAVAVFLWAAGFIAPLGSGDTPTDWHRLCGWIIVLVPLPIAPASLILALLYFPDGRLANRWFRPAVWAVVAGSLLLSLGNLAVPQKLGLPQLGLRGPDWARGLPRVANYGGVWAVCVILGGLAVLASLVMRRRRASDEERRSLRWLLGMLVSLAGIFALAFAFMAVFTALGKQDNDATWFVLFFPFVAGGAIVLFGIPMALTVGVLRHRLYQADLTIRKTIVAGVMVGFVLVAIAVLVAMPVVATTGFGRTATLPTWVVAPAFLVGISLGPVRRWARRGADRILYGERATPYEVLSEFSERVGEAYSSQDVLPRMVQLLAAGTGASEARVWLRVGDELRDAARWPSDAPAASARPIADDPLQLPDEQTFSVVHQGVRLGALAFSLPPSDPMDAAKERLSHDLASQAGLVLWNVRLVEELRDSRRRLVTAQDERARTLERNIHDGAQQQLVALAVKLGLIERLVHTQPGTAASMLAEARTETGEALEDLRNLARGIYPPLLADKGLASALEAQARKSAVPVTIDADGIGRYPQEVETAVYFSILEALQNTAKYAGASRATVRLGHTNGSLAFEVADDGAGFDPGAVSRGAGLLGIADRLEAVGGGLDIRSSPGVGTTLIGRVPVEEPHR